MKKNYLLAFFLMISLCGWAQTMPVQMFFEPLPCPYTSIGPYKSQLDSCKALMAQDKLILVNAPLSVKYTCSGLSQELTSFNIGSSVIIKQDGMKLFMDNSPIKPFVTAPPVFNFNLNPVYSFDGKTIRVKTKIVFPTGCKRGNVAYIIVTDAAGNAKAFALDQQKAIPKKSNGGTYNRTISFDYQLMAMDRVILIVQDNSCKDPVIRNIPGQHWCYERAHVGNYAKHK